MNYFCQVLKKYAVFQGRARRKEYWMYTLFTGLFIFIIEIIFACIIAAAAISQNESLLIIVGIIFCLLMLAITFGLLIPTLAVSVRRLHDTGKSGWWYLICFIPFGAIVLLVFMCLDGTPGENMYGPNPKEIEN